MMICATAGTNLCIPTDNLSTAHKHYKTCANLCSAIKSTLGTCRNLSTAADPQCAPVPYRDIYQSGRGMRTGKSANLRNP